MKVKIIPIVIGVFVSPQSIIKGTGGLVSKRMRGDHPNFNIIKNGQNTEKSPGDLRILAVTKTAVKNSPDLIYNNNNNIIIIIIIIKVRNHQLMLV